MIEYNQLFKIPEYYAKYKIAEFLLEDIPEGDRTTEGLLSGKEEVTAVIQAEEDLIFVGEQIIDYFFDNTFKLSINFKDGQSVKKDEIIAVISGRADLILSRERTLLNLLQRLCGIATLTSKFVKIAEPYNVKILDTRKTTPGLRIFEKYAVVVGGGCNHRLDLSSGILIKDNHIKLVGSIREVIRKVKARNEKNLPVEIEVENLDEINEALEEGVDALLLDNFDANQLKEIVDFIREKSPEVFLEASGGINLTNLEDYVKTGVDAISSGSLTHSVKNSEIHMEFI